MSIQAGPQSGAPSKRPVTISGVDAGTQIAVSDYFGSGTTAVSVRNDNTTSGEYLVIQVNCLTRNYRPVDGLVHSEVRIWNTSQGASFTLDAGEKTPDGLFIESFQVTGNDSSSTVSITMW